MLGFYTIRKLAEAKKLPDYLINQRMQLISYAWLGEPVTKMNWMYYWELYDIENSRPISRDLLFVCHQIVHSYVFVTAFTETNELESILVTSDRERHKILYQISIQQIIDLFEQVGNNYPEEVTMIYNAAKQDYEVRYAH